MKKYIIFAGVNGAGKSTFYQSIRNVEDMPRVNADEIVRQHGDWKNASDVIAAGKIAVKKVATYLAQGITFNQETTLCGIGFGRVGQRKSGKPCANGRTWNSGKRH